MGFLPWNFSRLFFLIFFWTVLPAALPSLPRLKSAFMPNRHPLSRVPAFASIALRQPLRGPSNRAYDPEKSLHGFFWDCRIATQFCMLLSRPSMGSLILFKYENPSWIFLGLQNRYAILHVAKPPIHGLCNFYQVRKIPHLKKKSTFFTHLCQILTFTFYILYGGKNK